MPRGDAEGEVEDTQGKRKASSERSRLLTAALFVGICIGFVAAQFAYIYIYRAKGASVGSQTSVSKLGSYGMLDDSFPVYTGPPRSELERALRVVAPIQDGKPPEVLIAISTYNLVQEGMLNTWLDTVLQAGIKNYLVVGIDKQIRDYLVSRGYNVFYKEIEIDKSQEGTGSNHAISALKFKIIKEFLELGYNVLLSDVDIITLQNPFNHVYRDHDIEGMTDGFDEGTAYGKASYVDDESMGWARYAQGTEHLNLNSGCFYIRANQRTVALMARIAARLAKESAWDQAIFNHEIFFLSHKEYLNPQITVRVMDYYKFMNSKVLFKDFRYRPRADIIGKNLPVQIHINYHPNKHERMRAAIKFFLQGEAAALAAFPGGSEPGT